MAGFYLERQEKSVWMSGCMHESVHFNLDYGFFATFRKPPSVTRNGACSYSNDVANCRGLKKVTHGLLRAVVEGCLGRLLNHRTGI